MPNCVVKGCKNQSASNKKQDGITFHIFPARDINVKDKWIAIIRDSRNEPGWQPTIRSVICSKHFDDNDFYNTTKGLRRVKRNALPKVPSISEQMKEKNLSEPSAIFLPSVSDVPVQIKQEPQSEYPTDVLPTISVQIKEEPHTEPSTVIETGATKQTSVVEINVPPPSFCPFALYRRNHRHSQGYKLQHLKGTFCISLMVSVPRYLTLEIKQEDPSESPAVTQPAALTETSDDMPSPSVSSSKSDKAMDEILSLFYTPTEKKLSSLEKKAKEYKRNIKTLNQKVRRLENRNKSLNKIFENLKEQNYIDMDLFNLLKDKIAIVDIFNALNRQKMRKRIDFTPALKEFCLTLDSLSPKAYEYVRDTFNLCLPHPKTLAKWYGPLKGNPASTEEAFEESEDQFIRL